MFWNGEGITYHLLVPRFDDAERCPGAREGAAGIFLKGGDSEYIYC